MGSLGVAPCNPRPASSLDPILHVSPYSSRGSDQRHVRQSKGTTPEGSNVAWPISSEEAKCRSQQVLELGMTVDLYVAFLVMLVAMTLTVMPGHSDDGYCLYSAILHNK